MKHLLESIVKNLVDDQSKVQVNEVTGQNVILLEIVCPQGEVGKIIGKRGATIDAIRKIIIAVASKAGQRVNIEVVE